MQWLYNNYVFIRIDPKNLSPRPNNIHTVHCHCRRAIMHRSVHVPGPMNCKLANHHLSWDIVLYFIPPINSVFQALTSNFILLTFPYMGIFFPYIQIIHTESDVRLAWCKLTWIGIIVTTYVIEQLYIFIS